jgi:hypothetical protein
MADIILEGDHPRFISAKFGGNSHKKHLVWNQ